MPIYLSVAIIAGNINFLQDSLSVFQADNVANYFPFFILCDPPYFGLAVHLIALDDDFLLVAGHSKCGNIAGFHGKLAQSGVVVTQPNIAR